MRVDLSSSYEDILNLMMQDVSVQDIAQQLGRSVLATRRIIKILEEREGITYKPKKPSKVPYGMDNASGMWRVRLGSKLYELRELHDGDRKAVAAMVGLNTREQYAAERRPYRYDWTISQQQRLAKALGLTLEELLHGCF